MPVQNRIPFFMSPGKCDGNDLAADIQWLFSARLDIPQVQHGSV